MDFLLPHAPDDDDAPTAGYNPSPLLSPYYAAGRVLSPTFLSAVRIYVYTNL